MLGLRRRISRSCIHVVRAFRPVEHRCRVCGDLCRQAADIRPSGLASDAPNWAAPLSRRLCPACLKDFAPRPRGYCPKCGAFFADKDGPLHLCGECLARERRTGKHGALPWRSLFFWAAYHGGLRRQLLDFKFSPRLGLSGLLNELTLQTYLLRRNAIPEGAAPEMIVPIPLHARRLRKRGFNQSLEIGRKLAKTVRLPLEYRALTRPMPTRPQFELSHPERFANIKGAFAVDAATVRGRRVLLVDDIMTSGATLVEAANALLRAGAASVDALVLARTGDEQI